MIRIRGACVGLPASLALAAGSFGQVRGAPGIINVGHLPGGEPQTQAFGISADGAVVVGGSRGDYLQAFRWTAAGGIVGLGDLPGGSALSSARGASADGSVVVGYSSTTGGNSEAFRWSAGGGMVGLGTLGGTTGSGATGVSADGSVVAGYSGSAQGEQAFRWTVSGGMVGLGDLPGGSFRSQGNAISADGSTVVGWGTVASDRMRAFRWTASSGLVDLGLVPGLTQVQSQAFAVSADGSVVVGYVSDSSQGNRRAFRWDPASGMTALPYPGPGFITAAYGVSADGRVIVGSWTNPIQRSTAAAWINGDLLSIPALLVGMGVSLEGWILESAQAVSADGLVVAGYGTYQGVMSGWVAVIPSPGTLGVLVAPLVLRRRRRCSDER
jgi:probable HAF family extracellular repeat protein